MEPGVGRCVSVEQDCLAIISLGNAPALWDLQV